VEKKIVSSPVVEAICTGTPASRAAASRPAASSAVVRSSRS
jgi:hypothetical protein